MINSMTRSLITAKKYYRSMLAGNDAFNPGSFDLIGTTILSSTQSSVTLDVTGLGSTYKHLQVRVVSATGGEHSIHMRFNGDTSTNYVFGHILFGNGSGVGSSSYYGSGYNTYCAIGRQFGGTNIFAASIIDINDAFSAVKNKTVRAFTGDKGSSTTVRLQSSLWMSTSATTSVTFFNESDANFIAGSRFSIYGIKG